MTRSPHPDLESEAFAVEGLDAARRAEVLSAYLDDELSPDAARHVTAWLDAHPEALREAEHQRRLWDLLGLYADEPVPGDFATRVLARLRPARGASRRVATWGLLAAAASLLVAVGAALWASRPADVPPTEPSEVARVLDEVPPELLGDVDVLLSLSDEEFEGVLLADLDLGAR